MPPDGLLQVFLSVCVLLLVAFVIDPTASPAALMILQTGAERESRCLGGGNTLIVAPSGLPRPCRPWGCLAATISSSGGDSPTRGSVSGASGIRRRISPLHRIAHAGYSIKTPADRFPYSIDYSISSPLLGRHCSVCRFLASECTDRPHDDGTVDSRCLVNKFLIGGSRSVATRPNPWNTGRISYQ